MSKTAKTIFCLTLVFGVLTASFVSAAGIVPCGQTTDDPDTPIKEDAPCTLCHFFFLITNVVNFVLFKLAGPLALLMLIIGGAMFMLAAGNPQTITRARKLIGSVLIGLVIIYGAYFVIGLFLQTIGLAEWTEEIYSSWWEHGFFHINCEVPETTMATPPSTASSPSAPTSPTAFTPPVSTPSAWVTTNIGSILNNSGNLFTFHTNPIYSMAVSGDVNIRSPEGYARVMLTDTNGKQYLIYEAQGPFNTGSFSFDKWCDETCALNGIIPKSVDAEVSEATIKVSELFTLEDNTNFQQELKTMGVQSYQSAMGKSNEQAKIDKINQYIKANGLRWTAGKTSVSGYSHEKKKQLYGIAKDQELYNTQGFEYYKGGIFETARSSNAPKSKSVSASQLPSSFDWRDRHGENWMTPVKAQGYCGGCWAFATVGGIEAAANLYFNKQLNLNLSEQELISCCNQSASYYGCNGCYGGDPQEAIYYYALNGITTEDCFPYRSDYLNSIAGTISCEQRCDDWQNFSVRQDQVEWINLEPLTEQKIKTALIEKGPLIAACAISLQYPATLKEGGHAMVLAGYDTYPDSEQTIWIFKNSWGTSWGNQGYLKLFNNPSSTGSFPSLLFLELTAVDAPIIISYISDLQISCVDKDGDGYCNWGISKEKPSSCPSYCKSEEDCDDSNRNLGPYDSNYNCLATGQTVKDTTPPTIGPFNSMTIALTAPIWTSVSDNTKVVNCVLKIKNADTGHIFDPIPMDLSAMPCKSCTATLLQTQLINKGTYLMHVECWDKAGNIQQGKEEKISVGLGAETPSPQQGDLSVSKIQPSTASLNTSQRFTASVSDDGKVVNCGLKVNGSVVKTMNLSQNPCTDCTAQTDYTFTSKGTYSVLARCIDDEGNSAEGEDITINIGSQCPDCANNNTDLCENPPKCERDCGASPQCDEKKRFASWSSGNNCYYCNAGCSYKIDTTKPSGYHLSGNTCYFDCDIECGSAGWITSCVGSKTQGCPETKVSSNLCYYLRSCGISGCKYLGTDNNKLCSSAICTDSGWDNSSCQNPNPSETWAPCNPNPNWVCGESSGGSSPFCEGIHIGWGSGSDGEAACPQGTIAVSGLCQGKNDDSVKNQNTRVKIIPSPTVFANNTAFVAQSSWYCDFGCSGWFCGADGCAWAKCEPGSQSIDKIDLKIYNLSGSLVFNKIVYNQGEIAWDGKNNQGQQLANGSYLYKAKVYLKDGRYYANQGNIQILR